MQAVHSGDLPATVASRLEGTVRATTVQLVDDVVFEIAVMSSALYDNADDTIRTSLPQLERGVPPSDSYVFS